MKWRLIAALAALVVSYVAIGSGGPVAAAPPDVFVFGRGSDNAIWYRRTDGSGTWQAWRSIGGIATEAPTVVTYPDGRIAVFVRGQDGALYQRETSDGVTWGSGWTNLGGQVGGTAVAARDRIGPPGQFDVYVVTRGSDGRAWVRRYASDTGWAPTWSGPFGSPTDGSFVAAPAGISATAYSVGRTGRANALDIDILGTAATERPGVTQPVGDLDLALLRDYLAVRAPGGGLTLYTLPDEATVIQRGGQLVGGPAAGRDGDELVYAMGNDRAVWANGCCGSGWSSLGGIVLEAPGAVQAPGGDVLAARGYDASLWVRTSSTPAGPLDVWTPLGGTLRDAPVVVTMLV